MKNSVLAATFGILSMLTAPAASLAGPQEVNEIETQVREILQYLYNQAELTTVSGFQRLQQSVGQTVLEKSKAYKEAVSAQRAAGKLSAYQALQLAKDLNAILQKEYEVKVEFYYEPDRRSVSPAANLLSPVVIDRARYSPAELADLDAKAKATYDDNLNPTSDEAYVLDRWKEREGIEIRDLILKTRPLLVDAVNRRELFADEKEAEAFAVRKAPGIVSAFQAVQERLAAAVRFGHLSKTPNPNTRADSGSLIQTLNGTLAAAISEYQLRYSGWFFETQLPLFNTAQVQTLSSLGLGVGSVECVAALHPRSILDSLDQVPAARK